MTTENTNDLKAQVDLAWLVSQDLGAPRRRRGRWLFWRCPFHNDRDPSFGVTADTGRFKCFGCGETGDHLDYLQKRRGLAFTEAKAELRRLVGLPDVKQAPGAADTTPPDDPPSETWQGHARAFTAWAAEQLWGADGGPGLAYLRAGGLTDETIRAWGLGWCPGQRAKHWQHDGRPVYLPRGVVIPCEVSGVLWYVKVRRFTASGEPETAHGRKYGGPAGGRGALFGADRFRADGRPLLLCEGERDALLAWQELADLVDVATLGGAGKRNLGRWVLWLLSYKQILAAYDCDDSGEKGAAELATMSRRVVPVRVPHGADLTDFHSAGGDLRAWIAPGLRQVGAPSPWAGQRVKITDLPRFLAERGLRVVGGDPDLDGEPWQPKLYLEER